MQFGLYLHLNRKDAWRVVSEDSKENSFGTTDEHG
jgi:hypothetical protein